MKYICAGLGNKGEEYKGTRHNAGAIVLAAILENAGKEWVYNSRCSVRTSTVFFDDKPLVCALPVCYMNESGGPLRSYMESTDALILLYDDIDLPLGEYKLSFGRSGAGHNGVKSVIAALGTQNFLTIRLGISPRGEDGVMRRPIGKGIVQDFVMKEFSKRELEILIGQVSSIVKTLETIVLEGKEKALSSYKLVR